MSKTIKHEVNKEAKADKLVPNWKRARQEAKVRMSIDDFYIYESLVRDGEPQPRGWWTG